MVEKNNRFQKFKMYFPWSEENRNTCVASYAAGNIPQVYIELGRACSLKCVYCDSPERNGSYDALYIDEIERLLEQLQELGLQFVFVCGHGEPLNDPRMLPLLRSAKSRHLHVSFFSNLQPAYQSKPVLEELAELQPNILAKFDTLDPKIFDTILGVSGSAAKIFTTVEQLCRSNFLNINNGCSNLGLSIVPTSYNIDVIPDVIDFALDIGAYPCIGELEIKGLAETHRQKLAVTQEKLGGLKEKIFRQFGCCYERPLCQGVFCGLHVRENGDCVIDMNTGLSCDWFLPTANRQVIGNVRTDNIRDIWQTIVKRRTERLEETFLTLTTLSATFGLGGGAIPDQWAQTYRESTLHLIS